MGDFIFCKSLSPPAVEFARRCYGVDVIEKSDIVISNAYLVDLTLRYPTQGGCFDSLTLVSSSSRLNPNIIQGGKSMSNNISVGFSTDKNGDVAVSLAIETALENLDGKPSLAILFSTIHYDCREVVKAAQNKLAGIPLWGGTSSAGIIAPDRFMSGEDGTLGIMLMSGIQAGVAGAELGADAVLSGLNAAKAAREQLDETPEVLLLLGPPGGEERVIEGIRKVVPSAPIVGGSAADNTLEGLWRQFANDKVGENCVTVAALSGVKFGCDFSGCYNPTGKTAKVTKTDGRTIIELDGKPALSVYSALTGKKTSQLLGDNILVESILAPIAKKIGDFYQVAHLANCEESGKIGIFVTFSEGDEVELLAANVDELVRGVRTVVEQAAKEVDSPAGVLLVHCAGRRIAIGERMDEVSTQVKDAAGEVPVIGFLSFGEQGTIATGGNYPTMQGRGEATFQGNLMLSALVFGR